MRKSPTLTCALALVFSIALHSSFAQTFSVLEITRREGEWKFPVIKSNTGAGESAANKINFALQTDIGGDPGMEDPFMMVPEEDQYDYNIAALNSRVVSFKFWGAHSGAGYHLTEHYYNFDSNTGAQIQLNNLFGKDGQASLRKILCAMWKKSLEDKSRSSSLGEEYKRCLAESVDKTEIEVDNMQITDTGIKLWCGLCLDGSNASSDEAKGPHELSFAQLAPLLTPYGFSLFIDKPSKAPFHMLLRGTVATYPINLILLPGSDPGTISGKIVYDRVGEPLNLKGTVNGNKLTLHEVDASDNPYSDIEVTWDGKKLSGTFLNLKTKKQLPFVASAPK